MFYTYVLYSEKDHGLYIGYSSDMKRRMKQHADGETLSTAHRRPLMLAYYEAYVYRIDAETRERFLKSGSGRRFLKKQMRVFFRKNPLRTASKANP